MFIPNGSKVKIVRLSNRPDNFNYNIQHTNAIDNGQDWMILRSDSSDCTYLLQNVQTPSQHLWVDFDVVELSSSLLEEKSYEDRIQKLFSLDGKEMSVGDITHTLVSEAILEYNRGASDEVVESDKLDTLIESLTKIKNVCQNLK